MQLFDADFKEIASLKVHKLSEIEGHWSIGTEKLILFGMGV